ncbi:ABC transporter permease [Streptomyces sp. MN03-5084-2B]|nr:ABC transporter permease [Streptomyces sp. MN03-5084-2B]
MTVRIRTGSTTPWAVRAWHVLAGFCARDWALHFRSPLSVVGTLAGPLLLLVAVGIGLGGSVAPGQQENILALIVPGLCAMSALLVASQRSVAVFHDRSSGLIDEIVTGPVSRPVVVVAQALSSATLATVHGLVMLVLAVVLGAGSLPGSPVAFTAAIAAFALLSSSLCNAMAYGASKPGTIQSLLNLVINPLFFLSGALYDVTTTVVPVRVLALVNPLHYAVRLIQAAYAETPPDGALSTAGALAVVVAVVVACWAMAVRFSRRG